MHSVLTDQKHQPLQANEHDHAWLPFLGSEGRLPGIQHVAELREDGLLDDAALVGACGERLEVDDALDVGLHVADHLELDVGLQERARDLVEAVAENLLVDDGGVAQPRQRAGDAPAELREHHLAGFGGFSLRRRSLREGERVRVRIGEDAEEEAGGAAVWGADGVEN